MTITVSLQRELLLRRLLDHDLDEDLSRSLERLRRFFFKPWAALDELCLSPGADPSKLLRWRRAPSHSPEWRKARDFDRALEILAFWESIGSSTR